MVYPASFNKLWIQMKENHREWLRVGSDCSVSCVVRKLHLATPTFSSHDSIRFAMCEWVIASSLSRRSLIFALLVHLFESRHTAGSFGSRSDELVIATSGHAPPPLSLAREFATESIHSPQVLAAGHVRKRHFPAPRVLWAR